MSVIEHSFYYNNVDMMSFIPNVLASTSNSDLVATIAVTAIIGLLILAAVSIFVVEMPFLNEVIHTACAVLIVIFSFKVYGTITWAEWWKYFLIRFFALSIWITFTEIEVWEDRYSFQKEKVISVKVKAGVIQKAGLATLSACVVIFITDGIIPLITNGIMFSQFTFLGWFGIIMGLPSLFFVGRSVFDMIKGLKR